MLSTPDIPLLVLCCPPLTFLCWSYVVHPWHSFAGPMLSTPDIPLLVLCCHPWIPLASPMWCGNFFNGHTCNPLTLRLILSLCLSKYNCMYQVGCWVFSWGRPQEPTPPWLVSFHTAGGPSLDHVWMCVCVCVCVHVCVHACMRACVYACSIIKHSELPLCS